MYGIDELIGGGLIGLSAAVLLLFNGKIAGISGIFYRGVLSSSHTGKEKTWCLVFVAAMMITGAILMTMSEGQWQVPLFDQSSSDPFLPSKPIWLWALAGLFVGMGTKLANGCTSGHAVCGVGRLSKRSIIATVVFITTAALTVWIQSHIRL
ncbi:MULTISPECIES: YeeE/YedE family protein [unclassified Vibrio]|uniref:YeeE/YedE family protein n=1 Tax=Vibrio sp. HB236076 TaxID=3232307 RepID=A0AB39HK87_9VIBR|nr:YeeE/YedE family protein [Vibrio sp. HB161653]MDP5252961.1 YeeE/YedE family protein [Vibrio sp. HB161653]